MTTRIVRIALISVTACVAVLLGINLAVAWYIDRLDARIEPPLTLVNRLAAVPPQTSGSEQPSDKPPADLLAALRTPRDFHLGYSSLGYSSPSQDSLRQGGL